MSGPGEGMGKPEGEFMARLSGSMSRRASLATVTGTITGVALVLLMLVGAGAQNNDHKRAQEIALEMKSVEESSQNGGRALTDAYNASGFALFKQLSGSPGNIVFSPFSVGTAMAMALSGARGETEREMASVLKLHLDRPAMEAANGAVLSGLRRYDQSALAPKCPVGMEANGGRCEETRPAGGQCSVSARREGARCVAPGSSPPSARLLTANALMLTRRGDLVAADYATLLRDKYGAEVFQNVTLEDVNGWVERKTEGKIERIVERLDPSSPAVILNAVYFKAKWAAPFSKARTTDDVFNLSRQKRISVPTMRREGTEALVTRPLYRAIRLPYEVASLGMIVVLPNEVDGLEAVSRRLDADEWAQLAGALRVPGAIKPVDLALPRFKASSDSNLAPLFRAAGMARAFDLKQADFSGMTGHSPAEVPFAIGSIAHRAVIDVIEDGTEAAAATALVSVTASLHTPPDEQLFRVDRPFLFAILDEASGAILFQGRVVDPR
jgi:serpin B